MNTMASKVFMGGPDKPGHDDLDVSSASGGRPRSLRPPR